MGFYINAEGNVQQVKLENTLYKEAVDKNVKVAHLINMTYKDADPKKGTAFQQIAASEGLSLVGKNPFGLRAASIHDILEGNAGFQAGGTSNSRERGDPLGNQSRILFPSVVIEMVEDMFYDSRSDEDVRFRDLVKTTVPVADDYYRQPVLSYQKAGGANKGADAAKAARVTQLGELPNMLTITTSERAFNIPAYGIGIEMSQEAMKGTTLDLFGLTMKRYIDIEHNARVNTYLSNLFLGDTDQNNGAVPAVTTNSLDAAATGGVVTHKAWVKWLARNRRRRKITHVMCDLDTYLKIESRTGRPGSNNYDPTLARIDPQLVAAKGSIGFGNDVKWLIVDDAANGGPVPANTVWGLDQSQAIKLVTNTSADYKATEEFVLRRSSRMIWTWSEEALRLFGDTDLTAFDVLVIS
jgi:hypothetical protein